MLVGDVDTVSTTAELRSAIIKANNQGGNMTILIEDGTYPVASTSWYPYITASNVVIRSLSGNRNNVIISGQGMKDVAPKVEIGIYAVGDSITIADLTIKDVGNHGIAATGEHLFVHNIRIQDTYEQMIKGTSGSGGPDSAIVQCSLFEYTKGIGPQYYIGGLDIHRGDYWLVRDNVFIDIASPSRSAAEHAIHFWNNCSHNVIERNIIVNCDRGIGFGLGTSQNTGGIIRNNMIFNNGDDLFDDVGIGLETSPGTKVFNNTVLIDYPNAIEYRFAATKNVLITNNLCNKQIKLRNGASASLAANITNADPTWFVDPSKGNLRLKSLVTQVVDQGIPVSPVLTNDIDQVKRFEPFDIGAHEYGVNGQDEVHAQKYKVYPNPSNGVVYLDVVEGTIFKVYTIDGRLLATGMAKEKVDISEEENGMFLLQLFLPDGSVVNQSLIKI